MPSRFSLLRLLTASAVGLLSVASTALANTPGRAWTPVQIRQSVLGPTVSPRLELDQDGNLILFGAVSRNDVGFRWDGHDWPELWLVGRGLNYNYHVDAPAGQFWIVGQDPFRDSQAKAWFWLSQKQGDTFQTENAVYDYGDITTYSAAVTSAKRWIIYPSNSGGFNIFCSAPPGPWTQTAKVSSDPRYGLDIAALDDTSAILTWGGVGAYIGWGIVSGSKLTISPDLIGRGHKPTLRHKPSGGFWMGYMPFGDSGSVRSFEQGTWGPTINIPGKWRDAAYTPSGDWFAFSYDNGEYPAIALEAFVGSRGVEGIAISVPTDTGWTNAEELENDEEGIVPSLARDGNGDVWVAFFRLYQSGIWWCHTYTRATSSVPVTQQQGPSMLVSWQLSEPAPETWWAVLRQKEDGSFESVGRVRAGSSTEMSWLDNDPPPGAHYRIRRECLDKNYEWLSDPSDNPVPALATLASAIAKPGQVDLSWYAQQSTSATVYRRTTETDWSALGPADSRGDGLLTYTDRGVTAGRYAYRLGVGEQFTPETWVDVPSGYTLALEGSTQNPARGPLQIAFTLADDSPATLDVFAVNGRRVASRDVSSMGAGPHLLDLSGEGMRPGVYWIRLTQSGRTMSKKAVVAN